jgi:hypothetical protein
VRDRPRFTVQAVLERSDPAPDAVVRPGDSLR